MAKRRGRGMFRRRSRSRARSSFRSFKRRGRRSNRSGLSTGGIAATVIGGVAYGAMREWASDKLAPLTSKIPAGQYADEVGMGVASYLLATGKIPLVNKLPYAREIGRAGLTIESARIGANLGNSFGSMTSTSSTASW